eukprot:PhF_6_TR28268/c0_g1_i1/m.41828
MDRSLNDDEDDTNSSIYSALGNLDIDDDGTQSVEYLSHRTRLIRFYEKYNPEKLSRVDEFLNAYRGDEERLFTILVGKYGPEPMVSSRSTPHTPTLYRRPTPTHVPPDVGNTNGVTPYWPNVSTITDVDFAEVLLSGVTNNSVLKPYVDHNVYKEFPMTVSNGVVLRVQCPVPQSGSVIGGHTWARNSITKTVTHPQSNTVLTRVTFTCKCGTSRREHERWRMVMYAPADSLFMDSKDDKGIKLFRFFWDPPRGGVTGSVASSGPLDSPYSNSSLNPKQKSAFRPLGGFSRKQSRNEGGDNGALPPLAPPSYVEHGNKELLDGFASLLQGMEQRLITQIGNLEKRVGALEEVVHTNDRSGGRKISPNQFVLDPGYGGKTGWMNGK